MMKFLKIYLLGIIIAFSFMMFLQLFYSVKVFFRTKKVKFYIDWKTTIYYSFYSFGFFAIALNEYLEDYFDIR